MKKPLSQIEFEIWFKDYVENNPEAIKCLENEFEGSEGHEYNHIGVQEWFEIFQAGWAARGSI